MSIDCRCHSHPNSYSATHYSCVHGDARVNQPTELPIMKV